MKKQPSKAIDFNEVVDQAYDHIIITDADGTIVYANQAVSHTTGYSHKEVIGKTPRLWGGLMSASFYQSLWKTIKDQKQPFVGELKNKRKDGTVYTAEAHVAPILNAKKEVEYFIGIERDITAIKRLDDSRNEFISLVSHQLRTPLSTLNWYTESLLDGDTGKLTHQQKTYATEVYDATQRMIKLVNDLLNSTRIDFGDIRLQSTQIDLYDVFSGIIRDAQMAIKQKKLTVTNHVDTPRAHLIYSDQPSVYVVFENLITNAIKYTPPEGQIDIAISTTKDDVTIAIKDTGYGINEDDKTKIFNKYFRSESIKKVSTEGTGLGLYITKSFVQALGGTITFKSSSKGTVFYVTLPVHLEVDAK